MRNKGNSVIRPPLFAFVFVTMWHVLYGNKHWESQFNENLNFVGAGFFFDYIFIVTSTGLESTLMVRATSILRGHLTNAEELFMGKEPWVLVTQFVPQKLRLI